MIPAPQRAAGRKKLAAQGAALPDGSFPIPNVDYLKRAVRSVGRAPASKRPALKALIAKRAKALGATSVIKGTWVNPAKSMANDGEAMELAMKAARRMPVIRGAADIQLSRSGPGQITAMHKSSGRKIGTIVPKGRGYAGTHADGKPTGASGGQQGALAGLIQYHNGLARNPAATSLANGARALDLAGALPVSTPANSSSDGPRVTSMGGSGSGKAPAGSPSGLSPYAAALYRKFIAKKMKPAVALAFAKRADAMHMKAAKAA